MIRLPRRRCHLGSTFTNEFYPSSQPASILALFIPLAPEMSNDYSPVLFQHPVKLTKDMLGRRVMEPEDEACFILPSSKDPFEVAEGEEVARRAVPVAARKSALRSVVYTIGILTAAGLLAASFFSTTIPSSSTVHFTGVDSSVCRAPSLRVEWRSLNKAARKAYIDAVQCLCSTPSMLSLPRSQSLYDDFPYVHMHVGNITHDTAGFLPWHRYFVHLYEKALRKRCGYTGPMAYWDWSLDSTAENFRQSPVFDAESGFGGDGGLDAPRSVGEGRCVTDGPFAGMRVLYSNLRYRPHCFARGFPSEKELARWTATFNPEAVAQVMRSLDYKDFYLSLENGPHLGIPYSIRGDFFRFTAPYGKLVRSVRVGKIC